jgi:hypothetical protein
MSDVVNVNDEQYWAKYVTLWHATHNTKNALDTEKPMRTYWKRPIRKDSIHLKAMLLIP